MPSRLHLLPFAVAVALAAASHHAPACPYCTVESQTLTEEMAASDAVVIATLIEAPQPSDSSAAEDEFTIVDPETGEARFKIERVIVGQELLEGQDEIRAIFFGEPGEAKRYFIRGVGVKNLDWNIPMPLSDAALQYIEELLSLPDAGPERMAHFLQYLQHEDPLLAQDTYDEYARAPYSDLIAIADQIDRNQLWNWIEDRDVSPSRRSLFFTMLGVCGQQEDEERLEKMMLTDQRVLRAAAEATSALGLGLGGAITLPVTPELVAMEQRRKQLGFNALVGCYLKLTGDKGLDIVDKYFLADDDADPTKVYGALIALRFLAEETNEVTMDRLLESMRLVLDKPDFAEQAITDLARWEDWTVLDRLVTMFSEAPEDTYVKEPIVAYLDQARRQEGDVGTRATVALEEIEKIDPDTVKRARSLLSFGFLGRAQGKKEQEQTAASADELADDTKDNADALEANLPGEDLTDPLANPSTSDGNVAIDSATTGETPLPTAAAAPNKFVIFGLPLVAAAVLMGLVWLLLRSGV